MIVGAAMEVHRMLGPGFLEAVYQAALAHEAQAINYLAATGLRLAILLNFGAESLEHKRLVK
jgi:hypothetical protein